VLGPDVFVIEPLGFLIGQLHHLACSVSKSFVHVVSECFVSVASNHTFSVAAKLYASGQIWLYHFVAAAIAVMNMFAERQLGQSGMPLACHPFAIRCRPARNNRTNWPATSIEV
jgi:hypothetical protein